MCCQYFPTFGFISHIPFSFSKSSIAWCSDSLAPIIEWLDWLTLSELEQGEWFPPFLELVDMEREEQDVCEVLAQENWKFQENLAVEVSQAYLAFFYYIPRFIGANFFLLYFSLASVSWRLLWLSGQGRRALSKIRLVYFIPYIL